VVAKGGFLTAVAPLDLPVPPSAPVEIKVPAKKVQPAKADSATVPISKAGEPAPAAALGVVSALPPSNLENREAAPAIAAPAAAPPPPTVVASVDVRPTEASRPQSRSQPIIDPGSACPKLEYPPSALRTSQTGIVALRFLIDVDGKVIETRIDRSSGYRFLDEAARVGLSRCKFVPAKAGNQAEQAWGKLEYEWRLD
jgi:protein TonB